MIKISENVFLTKFNSNYSNELTAIFVDNISDFLDNMMKAYQKVSSANYQEKSNPSLLNSNEMCKNINELLSNERGYLIVANYFDKVNPCANGILGYIYISDVCGHDEISFWLKPEFRGKLDIKFIEILKKYFKLVDTNNLVWGTRSIAKISQKYALEMGFKEILSFPYFIKEFIGHKDANFLDENGVVITKFFYKPKKIENMILANVIKEANHHYIYDYFKNYDIDRIVEKDIQGTIHKYYYCGKKVSKYNDCGFKISFFNIEPNEWLISLSKKLIHNSDVIKSRIIFHINLNTVQIVHFYNSGIKSTTIRNYHEIFVSLIMEDQN
ncbi:MAG: hypothetical protein ACRC4L_00820 [Mycoplasma sp.]